MAQGLPWKVESYYIEKYLVFMESGSASPASSLYPELT